MRPRGGPIFTVLREELLLQIKNFDKMQLSTVVCYVYSNSKLERIFFLISNFAHFPVSFLRASSYM